MATRKPSRLVSRKSPRRSAAGAKATAWDEDVELAVLLAEGSEEGVDLLVAGDVALEAGGAGEFGDEALGLEPHALVLVADGHGCAGLVQFLCDAPGDGTLVGQPEDYGRLTRQMINAFFLPPGSASRGMPDSRLLEYQSGSSMYAALRALCGGGFS